MSARPTQYIVAEPRAALLKSAERDGKLPRPGTKAHTVLAVATAYPLTVVGVERVCRAHERATQSRRRAGVYGPSWWASWLSDSWLVSLGVGLSYGWDKSADASRPRADALAWSDVVRVAYPKGCDALRNVYAREGRKLARDYGITERDRMARAPARRS